MGSIIRAAELVFFRKTVRHRFFYSTSNSITSHKKHKLAGMLAEEGCVNTAQKTKRKGTTTMTGRREREERYQCVAC